MKCTQFYPVIMTDDVAGTARFYQDNFRFSPGLRERLVRSPPVERRRERQYRSAPGRP